MSGIDTTSHSERDIFNGCVEIMRGMVEDFKNWYLDYHGEDALEMVEAEELFGMWVLSRKLVEKLFLEKTDHHDKDTCIAKMHELGIDKEFLEFGFEVEHVDTE